MEKIVVLCGGRSAEHEVSIVSARSIIKGLNQAGYKTPVLGIGKDGSSCSPGETEQAIGLPAGALLEYPETSSWIAWLSSLSADNCLVFPVLHGPYGEDGTVQGVLELLDLPYIGAGVCGSAVAMNKIHTKQILESQGLPVLPWIGLTHHSFEKGMIPEISAGRGFEYPVFVKPANMGSSVGISRVDNREGLVSALRKAFRYDEHVLVEKGINAREIEISVLGFNPPGISVPGEIIPDGEFYSYEAKYESEASKLVIPAELTAKQLDRIQDLAAESFSALQLEGMARVDFLIDRDDGTIWINEPNTIPGFTDISMYPKLWAASGMPFPELLNALVELARDRKKRRDKLEVDR